MNSILPVSYQDSESEGVEALALVALLSTSTSHKACASFHFCCPSMPVDVTCFLFSCKSKAHLFRRSGCVARQGLIDDVGDGLPHIIYLIVTILQ